MAKTLQEVMDQRGWNDAEVARRLDGKLSRSQVNRIRRGISVPPPASAQALATLTGIPAGDLALGRAAPRALAKAA